MSLEILIKGALRPTALDQGLLEQIELQSDKSRELEQQIERLTDTLLIVPAEAVPSIQQRLSEKVQELSTIKAEAQALQEQKPPKTP